MQEELTVMWCGVAQLTVVSLDHVGISPPHILQFRSFPPLQPPIPPLTNIWSDM
jgi:hypothetical protein